MGRCFGTGAAIKGFIKKLIVGFFFIDTAFQGMLLKLRYFGFGVSKHGKILPRKKIENRKYSHMNAKFFRF
jgi:hypothetical protein